MNALRGRLLITSLIGGAVCLVAINTWLAFRSISLLDQSQHWVQHTYQTIAQVEIILGSAKDAETGERGFLITGDDAFLKPYDQAVHDLSGELDTFQSLTSDNPRQQKRIAEMRDELRTRMALLQQGIDIRRGGASLSEPALEVAGTGKAEMDRLRQIGRDMENEEQGLLVTRLKTARSASVRSRITLGFASGLDLLLLLLMFRFFAQERRLRLATQLSAARLAEAQAETEARAMEVRNLNATLEERVRQRTAELETINGELEAFSYSVSHDLRAPLRTVDGFSLALEEEYAEAVDAVGRDYIRRVRGGVQRMGQLIDALLQLSRITRADLQREDFNMSTLVESIGITLQQESGTRDIELRIQPWLTANGDPKLIRVALENLLGNAVKFTSKLPYTLVQFGWDPDQKAWFIKDNGAGFDMAYANKLFNAFNRLHGDKDFKGSGIGLATVARVIRRHHGRIWAESAVDRGATFWFTLG